MNDPTNATARLFRPVDEKSGTFLGTCFAYRNPFYMLTAAHCIGKFAEENLTAVFEDGSVEQVIKVTTHDTADIAILQLAESPNRTEADFFGQTLDNLSMGLPFLGTVDLTGAWKAQ